MTASELVLRHCPWMLEGKRLLGQEEIPGPQTASFISAMLKNVHAWWGDDETPWCGVFVAHCLKASGYPIAKQWWKARGWVGFGQAIPLLTAVREIPFGALVVLDRPPSNSNGHVGFFAGRTEFSGGAGLVLLGGNQGNKVCHASFPLYGPKARKVLHWCWPGASLSVPAGQLLVAHANGRRVVAMPTAGEA